MRDRAIGDTIAAPSDPAGCPPEPMPSPWGFRLGSGIVWLGWATLTFGAYRIAPPLREALLDLEARLGWLEVKEHATADESEGPT